MKGRREENWTAKKKRKKDEKGESVKERRIARRGKNGRYKKKGEEKRR